MKKKVSGNTTTNNAIVKRYRASQLLIVVCHTKTALEKNGAYGKIKNNINFKIKGMQMAFVIKSLLIILILSTVTYSQDSSNIDKLFELMKDRKPEQNNTNGKAKASIMRTVIKNLPELKNEYKKELKKNFKIEGKIKTVIVIDESGKVVSNNIVVTTLNDTAFQNNILKIINKWDFGKISQEHNETKVEYIFVFIAEKQEVGIGYGLGYGSGNSPVKQ
jgi:hypothetical protein